MIRGIINFFSTRLVHDKILKNSLSEGQLFIYFYMVLIYDAIGFTQQWLAIAGKEPQFTDWVNIWGNLLVTAIGLVIVFYANGGSKGHQFLTKYFSFSVTVGIKYAIAFIILGMLPMLFPFLNMPIFDVGIFVTLNTLMVANIAYRIYSTR
jgi:hypothetical protein